MSNKGLKLRLCRECKKKRYCKRESIPGYNFRITCSKGHTWTIVGITAERVASAMQDIFSSERLAKLFDRDDLFYKTMKR